MLHLLRDKDTLLVIGLCLLGGLFGFMGFAGAVSLGMIIAHMLQ